jgi:hypothetical protein
MQLSQPHADLRLQLSWNPDREDAVASRVLRWPSGVVAAFRLGLVKPERDGGASAQFRSSEPVPRRITWILVARLRDWHPAQQERAVLSGDSLVDRRRRDPRSREMRPIARGLLGPPRKVISVLPVTLAILFVDKSIVMSMTNRRPSDLSCTGLPSSCCCSVANHRPTQRLNDTSISRVGAWLCWSKASWRRIDSRPRPPSWSPARCTSISIWLSWLARRVHLMQGLTSVNGLRPPDPPEQAR